VTSTKKETQKSSIWDPLPIANRQKLQNLIEGIGGKDALVRILDDFYQRMSKDTLIGFFFAGKNLQNIVEKQSQFLLKAAGLTEDYKGLPPQRAHSKLPPILGGHFDRRTQILKETLEAYQLSKDQIEIWLGFERTFRDAILNEKRPS
jgi:hemoglobin